MISAYNDPTVIAGQATIGRELDTQTPGELTVVVPVGGGGLLAGLALWARSRPGVRLAGVESSESRGISAAVAADIGQCPSATRSPTGWQETWNLAR